MMEKSRSLKTVGEPCLKVYPLELPRIRAKAHPPLFVVKVHLNRVSAAYN